MTTDRTRSPEWAAPPPPGPIGEGQVHVWRAALDGPEVDREALSTLLSPSEQARRDRFVFEIDRRRYAASRGLLRALLARYLAQDPAGVTITEEDNGKPAVPATTLRFNVSHSGDAALFAFTGRRRIGVDVERVRTLPDAASIAARWYGPSERQQLDAMPEPERVRAFLECWTSKEAHVKALGSGLGAPLAEIDIWRGVGERRYRTADGTAWTLRQLAAGEGLVASLVVEGDGALRLATYEAAGAIPPRTLV